MSGSKPKALITGASRGIGAECARKLARDGYHVILNFARNAEAAQAVLQSIEAGGGSGELLPFDVASLEAAKAALAPFSEPEKALDALVINAGVRVDIPLVNMLPEEWSRVINVNLNSFYHVVHPVIRGMLLNRRGNIVAVSSVSGQTGMPGQVNYSASKAGLIGAVKALAKEVAKRKIRVNAVTPGFIETDMLNGIDPNQIKAYVPLGRIGTVQEVAAAVSFLLSEASGYITGQVLSINGGISL
jgi:3-oxoacyl-[acyl-carrier protein] reductase